MKVVTVERTIPPNIQPNQLLDLSIKPTFPKKPPRRKTRHPGSGIRLKKEPGTPSAKQSTRPVTPLLKWKFNDKNKSPEEEEVEEEEKYYNGKCGRKTKNVSSVRKLGATLWRQRLSELQDSGGETLGLQTGGGHFGTAVNGYNVDRVHSVPTKDLVHSPQSAAGPRNGLYKFGPSFQLSNPAMEGATKWDPVGWKKSGELKRTSVEQKAIDQTPRISALETELEEARTKIGELETERRSSKKKLEQFLRKLSEERAAWRSREHEKIRAVIDDMKIDLNREKKNRHRLELVNSKLVNELADAKLSAKRYLQEYEKERKAREIIEEVCDELAKEIGDDKAEVEALKRESMTIQEEVDEERKMLQMAEVWREERVQMKLIDAKVMLEDKYSQLNKLVGDLESFLNSNGRMSDLEEMNKAELLRQTAASVNIQDIRELTYEPPNPDDIFSIFEDVNLGESNEREAEPCSEYSPTSHASKIHTVSPEIKMLDKDNSYIRSNAYVDRSGELEEDASEWETVSHPDDEGSSYSPDGSDPSINKSFRVSNFSRNGTEWERSGGDETPVTEIGEVGSVQARQSKKVSSLFRPWKSNNDSYKIVSVEGNNERLSNGRISSATFVSSDCGMGKDGLSPQDIIGQWNSPDSGNPHFNRGMKGCIEWPRSVQKGSLKSRLLEARLESQKVQLRQVLKHKI